MKHSKFTQSVLSTLKSALQNQECFVPLHEPWFQGKEKTYLKECMDSTFVSSVGKFVDRFEADLAAYTRAKYVIAVVNGTSALHIALILAGVLQDDEVLVPTLTFVATANAVHYCSATPHFVDSDENNLGMAAEPLREYLERITEQRSGQCINTSTGRVIRALVPVHIFGHPCDMEGLLAISRDFNIALVEDAAESLGSFYHGIHTGTLGLMGTLSFNGNKIITTGGGGSILTNDPQLARKAKHLTTTAKTAHRWEYMHNEVGYNYRMPNLNAALGCAQLEELPTFLSSKRALFQRYHEACQQIPQVHIVSEPEGCSSNYWLQTLCLDESESHQRDAILEATNDAGLMTRPVWNLIHTLSPYKECPRARLPVTESLSKRLINLPSSAGIFGIN